LALFFPVLKFRIFFPLLSVLPNRFLSGLVVYQTIFLLIAPPLVVFRRPNQVNVPIRPFLTFSPLSYPFPVLCGLASLFALPFLRFPLPRRKPVFLFLSCPLRCDLSGLLDVGIGTPTKCAPNFLSVDETMSLSFFFFLPLQIMFEVPRCIYLFPMATPPPTPTKKTFFFLVFFFFFFTRLPFLLLNASFGFFCQSIGWSPLKLAPCAPVLVLEGSPHVDRLATQDPFPAHPP